MKVPKSVFSLIIPKVKPIPKLNEISFIVLRAYRGLFMLASLFIAYPVMTTSFKGYRKRFFLWTFHCLNKNNYYYFYWRLPTCKVSFAIGRTWICPAFQSVVITELMWSDSRQSNILFFGFSTLTLQLRASAMARVHKYITMRFMSRQFFKQRHEDVTILMLKCLSFLRSKIQIEYYAKFKKCTSIYQWFIPSVTQAKRLKETKTKRIYRIFHFRRTKRSQLHLKTFNLSLCNSINLHTRNWFFRFRFCSITTVL